MMNSLRAALLIGGLWLAGQAACAQRTAGYGDWQLHLPTNRARVVADAGKRVYVAAEDAFFAFDKETSTIQLLSRRDGLSDVGVRTVAYDSLTQQVLVAYRNGTLDILEPNGRLVTSISDIRRKAITGEKEIYSINFARRQAYLSTSFGIVVVDMQRREIRDTYANFAPDGTIPQTYATAVQGDSLYAATSAGLLRGRIGTNLLDLNNWRGTTGFGTRPGNPYRTLVTHQGKVFAGVNGLGLYRAVGGNWLSTNFGAVEFRALRASAAGLLISQPTQVAVLDTRTNQVRNRLQQALLTDVYDAVRASSGPVYVADFNNGLVRLDVTGQNPENFVANGPATSQAFSINADAASGKVTVFSGGYADRYFQLGQRNGFYEFGPEGRWTNITAQNLSAAQYPNPLDLSRGIRTPDGTLYAASYGQGLLEWKGPGEFRLFGADNSPLRSALARTDANYPLFVRLTDVDTDAEGNVWVINRHNQPLASGLFAFTPGTGTWRTFPYFAGSENLDRLALDDNGYVWASQARLGGRGLVAFNPATSQTRYFSETDGGLPSSTLYDVVKDRRGDIWVATTAGAAVYNDTGLAFEPGSAGFRTPIVRRGGGSGFPLLYTEVVKCIAVDGGNRKWLGTDNGLWLFNADGDEGLQHFTTDNSPLPSNKIVDVAVNDRTGEVFVATEGGLVAYRGAATVTEGKPDCAKVFPNPVRSDYSGPVGISGLANNAEVKITDITGTLVYQTRATGGSVVWNLADYNGRRVQSGVYLVLTSDAQGENGCIAKVAVLAK